MTDLAAALLRDVRRYEPDNPPDNAPSMQPALDGDWLNRAEVLAALSRALDPALTERAGEVSKRLNMIHEWKVGKEAADLITAFLAQNAALRAERDDMEAEAHAHIELWGKALREKAAAEAKVERLRGALQAVLFTAHADDHVGWYKALEEARAAIITETDNG